MKDKKASQSAKKEKSLKKMEEKKENMKELEDATEKNRKMILKKILKMEKRKKENDKKRNEHFQKLKEDNDFRLKEVKSNKTMLSKEEEDRRGDILYNENYRFNLATEKVNNYKSKRLESLNKYMEENREKVKKYREFKKIMNSLQDSSILKKNEKEKIQLFKEKVRKDEEELKKEEEKKLGLS